MLTRRRPALVAAVVLGLLGTAVPVSAARRVTVTGRVLDETGRGVPGATVRFGVEPDVPGLLDGLAEALECLFFFWAIPCPEPDRTSPLEVTARTDSEGRYVLRFDPSWRVGAHVAHDVEVTRAALVRGTLPPTTRTTVPYRGGRTLPTFRLWLRGATADPVNATQRRLRAPVPAVLGTPTGAPRVELVQGARTAWPYGDVPRDRTVDGRVAESGTTGTQTRVTTRIGSRYVYYRSGVRPLSKTERPISRGKRCYAYRDIGSREIPGCPLTDGRLADLVGASYEGRQVVVDLGMPMLPDAYLARGCLLYAVAASVEGVAYVHVDVEEKERRVYSGEPLTPVRYVRLDIGNCRPTEVAVYGSPLPLPAP